MTDQDKAEKNRRLMEWLGFLMPTTEETEEALRNRGAGIRRWTLCRRNNAPMERFSSYYWSPLDFYRSEEASALLLEKMPNDTELKHVVISWAEPMRYEWRLKTPQRGHFYWIEMYDADRKTCIAEAALRLMESEKK